jgi:hypothetical protein
MSGIPKTNRNQSICCYSKKGVRRYAAHPETRYSARAAVGMGFSRGATRMRERVCVCGSKVTFGLLDYGTENNDLIEWIHGELLLC